MNTQSELLSLLKGVVGSESVCDDFEYAVADLRLLALCMRDGQTICPVAKGESCPFNVEAEMGLAEWGSMGTIAFPKLKF